MPQGKGAGITTKKSRKISSPSLQTGHLRVISQPGDNIVDTPGGPPLRLPDGIQVTVSEGHRWPPPNKGGFAGDIGGDFSTRKVYCEVLPQHANLGKTVHIFPDVPSITRTSLFSGPVYAINPVTNGFTFPVYDPSNEDQLDEYGAVAVDLCKPTNSVADLSTALGELLHEGLPSLPGVQTWQSRAAASRKAGSEYLNVEFGWVPLVSDIKDVSKAVSRAGKILQQYQRDAGRQVRRECHLPSVRTSTDTVLSDNWTPYMSPNNTDIASLFSGRLVRTRTVSIDRWFSGAFTYWIPEGDDFLSRLLRQQALADKLFGTRLDPETLWNLAPWSWAVDWFSNTGSVISNMTSFAADGLVMRYGYMMEHSIIKDIYSYESTGSNPDPVAVFPMSFVVETKVRRKANPFGFGFSWDGLSPRQLAIAAALGLSKG